MESRLVQAPNKRKGGLASLFNYNGDAGPQLDAKPADESALKTNLKRNGTLEALRKVLEKENAILEEANQDLRHDKEDLETQVTVLRDTNTKLRDQLEQSERIRDEQTEELRQFQAQEYEKTKSVTHEPHEVISSQFQDIFRRCADWARDYFNIKMVNFDVRKFPEFKKELEEVSWDNSDWGSKELFKASHLVQAVLGNMICNQIFSSPFSGTPPDFYQQFQDMYTIKNYFDRAEAQRWRAGSLQTFYSCERWPLSGQASYPLQSYREKHAANIVRSVEKVLSPITATYYPSVSARELHVQRERLFVIVKYAKALSEKMSKQSSELHMFSKSWFNDHNRLFVPNDSRVESRLGDEDYDPQDRLRVDLILSPGFLKHGNDNAENLDVWSVWTPAIVEIHNPARLLPPPLSKPTATARTPASPLRDSEELPREMQKKEAAPLGTMTEEEHHDEEEFEEMHAFTNPWC